MKVLLTGSGGMLGRALSRELGSRGHVVVGLTRRDLDVTDPAEVRLAFERHAPEIVVQCAAYTAVDAAESEPDLAYRVNQFGAEVVAGECQRKGAIFVYPSTDYVFSGEGACPWKPGEARGPLNVYGASKAAGEQAALRFDRSLVVRTSWLYGVGGQNFVSKISELAAVHDEIDVVDDQIGVPTSTRSLSRTVVSLLEAGASGIFHASDGGDPVSWFGFATEIVERQGLVARIRPVATALNPRPARRPLYSVLDCSETERRLGRKMPDWRSMLEEYLDEIVPASRGGSRPVAVSALAADSGNGGDTN